MGTGSYYQYGAIELVDVDSVPNDQQPSGARFMYTVKDQPVGPTREKTLAHMDGNFQSTVRLCVQGFKDTPAENTSAPTLDIGASRTVMPLIPIHKWRFDTVDVSRAYLQSADLQ